MIVQLEARLDREAINASNVGKKIEAKVLRAFQKFRYSTKMRARHNDRAFAAELRRLRN